MLDQPHEKWIMGVIGCSVLSSILDLGFSLGDGGWGFHTRWTVLTASSLTLLFHSVTLPLWIWSEKKRQQGGARMIKPPFIYSVASCVCSGFLAVFWVATVIVAFLFVAVDWYEDHYTIPWVEAGFSVVNMGLMWAEFGLVVHHRRRFVQPIKEAEEKAHFSEAQLAEIREKPLVLTTTKLVVHTKWILALILVGLLLSIAELCLSLGSGAMGGYSFYMAPPAAGLTILLNVVTLVVWRDTAKRRNGTPKPSFIYSATLCTLTCLLAIYWLAPATMTPILIWLENDPDSRPYYYFDDRKRVVPWFEAVISAVMSLLMWAQFGLVVHYRKWFLRQVRLARYAGRIEGTIAMVPPPSYQGV
ncbi:hypothetical protein FRC17_007558 [Serendipita sp. 399]|nr:hypothetical protein FRC17_007558 [Serendipita sp. 399]